MVDGCSVGMSSALVEYRRLKLSVKYLCRHLDESSVGMVLCGIGRHLCRGGWTGGVGVVSGAGVDGVVEGVSELCGIRKVCWMGTVVDRWVRLSVLDIRWLCRVVWCRVRVGDRGELDGLCARGSQRGWIRWLEVCVDHRKRRDGGWWVDSVSGLIRVESIRVCGLGVGGRVESLVGRDRGVSIDDVDELPVFYHASRLREVVFDVYFINSCRSVHGLLV